MQKSTKELLEELNIIVLKSSLLEGNGYITHSDKYTYITINDNLSEEKQEHVLLHELGHLLDDDVVGNYKDDDLCRCKSESKANDYLIREMAIRYVAKVAKEDANYMNLADYLGVKDVESVNRILKQAYDNKT